MADTVALSKDEIHVLEMFSRQFRVAQIQATMAANLEAEYLAHLRGKYGLDDSWVCQDTEVGFVQVREVVDDD